MQDNPAGPEAKRDPALDAAPAVHREQQHAETRCLAPAPGSQHWRVTIDRTTPGCPLVGVDRVCVHEGPAGRSITTLIVPITLPLENPAGHLRAIVAACLAAAAELETGAA